MLSFYHPRSASVAPYPILIFSLLLRSLRFHCYLPLTAQTPPVLCSCSAAVPKEVIHEKCLTFYNCYLPHICPPCDGRPMCLLNREMATHLYTIVSYTACYAKCAGASPADGRGTKSHCVYSFPFMC